MKISTIDLEKLKGSDWEDKKEGTHKRGGVICFLVFLLCSHYYPLNSHFQLSLSTTFSSFSGLGLGLGLGPDGKTPGLVPWRVVCGAWCASRRRFTYLVVKWGRSWMGQEFGPVGPAPAGTPKFFSTVIISRVIILLLRSNNWYITRLQLSWFSDRQCSYVDFPQWQLAYW